MENTAWPEVDPAVRQRMSVTRSRDTRPEIAVRSLLHRQGLRYRVNHRVPPSLRRTVDIAFTRLRLAVFIDGLFLAWMSGALRDAKDAHRVLDIEDRDQPVPGRRVDAEPRDRRMDGPPVTWSTPNVHDHRHHPSTRRLVSLAEAAEILGVSPSPSAATSPPATWTPSGLAGGPSGSRPNRSTD